MYTCVTVKPVIKMVKRDDDHLQSQSSLPLLSKPNRMDSFLKQITKNPNISRWRYIFSFGRKNNNNNNNECVPLKAAVVEANNKTYLLDRIESLEDRLIQLSLEIETRRVSRTTSSTLTGARELPVSSYPVFNNPKPKCKHVSSSDILPISTGSELQNEEETGLEKQKHKRKNGNNINEEEEEEDQKKKTFKNGKKKAHTWPHLKLLGC